MKSPFDVVQLSSSTWKVVAWLEDGVIFLKEIHDPVNEANAVTYVDRKQWNPKHVRLNLFRMLLHHDDRHVRLNEGDKHMKISKVWLKDVCLVTQDEVNAVGPEARDVKIADRRHDWRDKSEKEDYFRQRWLQLWAYARLANQKTIVLCKKRANTLQAVEVLDASTVQVMERELSPAGVGDDVRRATWAPDQACDFLYRLLHFVRRLLTDKRTIPGRVIQLSYRKERTSFIRPSYLSVAQSQWIKEAVL